MDFPQKNTKGLHQKFPLRAIAGFLLGKAKAFGFTREKLPSCAALLVCPIITFYLFDLYTHNPFTTMDFKTQLLNIAFYVISGLFFFGVFKYVRLALMLQSALFMIAGLANYYVLNFRSAPIMPWDIYSVQTAAGVADNYDYSLGGGTIAVILAFLLLLAVESRFHMKAPAKKRKRGLLIVLSIVLLWGYTGMVQSEWFVVDFGLYDKLYTPTVMNRRDGNIVAFLMELEYLNVNEPAGYSAKDMERLYRENMEGNEALQAAFAEPESVNRPNVIVIMDEAFSDLSVLGDIHTNEDYMPFIHSLQSGADNTVTGYLNVSVLGGNTANTEFEFLTGSTVAFLPQGSVAYQQYVKGEMPSLASYLRDLDYETVAIHPYDPAGWDRNKVYPLLGFDTFLANEDFKNAEKIRKYVSDAACFKRIEKLYEEKEEGQPLFVFNVTMQNHSGYDDSYPNFTPDIEVEGMNSTSLPMYLSLIKQTDSAFQELITYFEQVPEDTIIVFFGDHQPTAYVSNPVLRCNGVDPNTLTDEENLLRYKVPYVIWANFDIEERIGQETSANYLMLDVLESCGLPLPAYQEALIDLRSQYPIVSAMQVRDAEGNYLTVDDCKDAMAEYHRLEYYLLFDYAKQSGNTKK